MPWALAIGAGLGFAGDWLNSKSQKDSADQSYEAMLAQIASNEAISEANIAAQMERFYKQLEWAQTLRDQELKGSTNAYTDAMYFDDRYGWMTDLSQDSQAIADAAQRQELLNRTEEDAKQRERSDRLAQYQRTEQLTADDLMNEYRNIDRVDPTELADLIYASRAMGRNNSIRQSNEAMNTTLNRMGNSSAAGDIMAGQAFGMAQQAQNDKVNALLQGMTGASDMTANRRSNVANEYNNFRDKSVQAWTPSFNPTSLGSFGTGNTSGSNSAMNAAFNRAVPQQDYVQTNFADALRTQAYGNANSNLLNSAGELATIFGNWYNDPVRKTGRDIDDLMKDDSLF